MTCQEDFGFPGDYQFSVAQVGLVNKSYLDKSKPFSPRLLDMSVNSGLCVAGWICKVQMSQCPLQCPIIPLNVYLKHAVIILWTGEKPPLCNTSMAIVSYCLCCATSLILIIIFSVMKKCKSNHSARMRWQFPLLTSFSPLFPKCFEILLSLFSLKTRLQSGL